MYIVNSTWIKFFSQTFSMANRCFYIFRNVLQMRILAARSPRVGEVVSILLRNSFTTEAASVEGRIGEIRRLGHRHAPRPFADGGLRKRSTSSRLMVVGGECSTNTYFVKYFHRLIITIIRKLDWFIGVADPSLASWIDFVIRLVL